MGVGQKFISLTIVAFGTSLPELVTSVTAARKQAQDIAIGNIIPVEAVYSDLIVMRIATLALFIFI